MAQIPDLKWWIFTYELISSLSFKVQPSELSYHRRERERWVYEEQEFTVVKMWCFLLLWEMADKTRTTCTYLRGNSCCVIMNALLDAFKTSVVLYVAAEMCVKHENRENLFSITEKIVWVAPSDAADIINLYALQRSRKWIIFFLSENSGSLAPEPLIKATDEMMWVTRWPRRNEIC